MLSVHEALDRLAAHDPRKAALVKLRYFVGMTLERHAHRGVAREPLRLALQRRLILRIDIILVEIEEDAVAHGADAGEEVFLRSRNDAGAGSGTRVGAAAIGRR